MIGKAMVAVLGAAGAGAGATVWNASLEARGNSGITGTARVETFASDSAQAEITVNGARPDGSLAWGLHRGRCATLGPLIGADSLYPALEVNSEGTSSAAATIQPGFDEAGEHSIVVHRGDRTGSVASCGELGRAE